MIKDEKQRITRIGSQVGHSISDIFNVRLRRTKRSLSNVAFKPIRRGTSQHVLDVADQMIKEYQSDLDYLKDK